MAIDQHGAEPLSAQVRNDLRRRIETGEFPVGSKIPSLRTLAGEYKIAELTVHAAIRELQNVGVLQSVSGRGTFVQNLPGDVDEGGSAVAALQAEVAELKARVEALENDRT